MRNLLPIFIVLSYLINGCVDDVTEKIDLTKDHKYFPLRISKYAEYTVDSILFRQGSRLDSSRSYLREEIVSKDNVLGQNNYTIFRSYKKNIGDNWTPVATWSVRLDQNKIIQNESNLHIIKMVFPASLGTSWDGLSLLSNEQRIDIAGESVQVYADWQAFKIKESPKPDKIGSFSFESVISVLQTDDDNLVSKRYSVEKFAAGVGLVFKEMEILDCNSTINDCANKNLSWQKRTTKGYILRQTITKYN